MKFKRKLILEYVRRRDAGAANDRDRARLCGAVV